MYGFTVESDLPISGLADVFTPAMRPDIRLDLAAIPLWAEQALSLAVTSKRTRPAAYFPGDSSFTVSEFAHRHYFELTYGDGTRFLMDCGATQIWGEPGPGLSHEDLCVYLLGPVMGFVLRQRGMTALHASGVAFQERAIALLGAAGAGKSTTAAALALRGLPVLCEDVCALRETAGQFQVLPAYPRICLWPDSVEFLFSSRECLPIIVAGWGKRFLPLDGKRARFASVAMPMAAVFLFSDRSDADSAPAIEPISQRDALLQLVQNTYMNWYLDPRQRADEFDVLTRLVSSVECFRVVPSSDPARLNNLAELIERTIMKVSPMTPAATLGAAPRNV
ncbi:MAG TPA: hypothetical protein VGF20_15575 [Candidatus Acidoferrum sp.]|jgi:hypothetical protein